MVECDFAPFIHKIGENEYQVIWVNENNKAIATTYRGRHAEKFAREDLEKIIQERNNERR